MVLVESGGVGACGVSGRIVGMCIGLREVVGCV